jgi:hypothetical protein
VLAGASQACGGCLRPARLTRRAASQHADELQRELSLVVFLSLTDELGDVLRPHFGTLAAVFATALGDSSPIVRTAALRAVGALAAQVQTLAETAAVAALVPGMVAVGRAALAAGDEDCAGLLFSVLDDMVESPAPLLAGQLQAVVELVVGVATDARLSPIIRASALGLVAWMAQYKPRALLKLRLVAPLLGALCPLCADVCGDDEADEERVEAEAVPAIACQALDAIATKVPSKHVLPTVLAFASANLNAAEPAARRAGLSALAYTIEGCAGALREQTAAQLAPFAAAALRDPAPEVRTAAALVLGQLAEHCSPAVLEAHGAVMPALLTALAESPSASAKRILYALDTWMDCLESDDLAPYLPGFCALLVSLLDNTAAPLALKELALSAAASAAAAAGQAFHPFLPQLMPRLQACLCLTDDTHLNMRSRALECFAMLLTAPGARDVFSPLFAEAMQAASAGFAPELDYSELREYGHVFFAAAASTAGPDFAPWLQGVIQHAFASLDLDDGVTFDDSDDDDDGDSADGDDERRVRNLSVRTGVLDEKASAARALGEYARLCGAAFTPFMADVLPALLRLASYFHENVRAQAFESIGRCVENACAAGTPLSPAMLHEVLEALATGAHDDDDKSAVAMAMEASAAVLRAAGKGSVPLEHLFKLSDAALGVLTRRASCQAEAEDASDAGSDEEADAEDEEEMLMSAVSELLPALATVMDHDIFLPRFNEHFKALMSRGRASAPEGERAEVSAILVQVALALGAAAAPCAAVAMPFVLRELASKDSGNRRNAVFLAGVLVQAAGASTAQQLPTLLAAMAPLISAAEPDAAVRDNAASAVSRILVSGAPVGDPRELMLALLAALPLREDMEETENTYGNLCALLRRGDAALAPFVPRIIVVFGEFAAQPPPRPAPHSTDATLKAYQGALRVVGSTVAEMLASASHGEQTRQLLGALPQEHAQKLAALAGM